MITWSIKSLLDDARVMTMMDYDDEDNKDKNVTVSNTLLLNDNPWVNTWNTVFWSMCKSHVTFEGLLYVNNFLVYKVLSSWHIKLLPLSLTNHLSLYFCQNLETKFHIWAKNGISILFKFEATHLEFSTHQF